MKKNEPSDADDAADDADETDGKSAKGKTAAKKSDKEVVKGSAKKADVSAAQKTNTKKPETTKKPMQQRRQILKVKNR